MDLRLQLAVLRRHWVLIVAAVCVAAAVAAVVDGGKVRMYSSTSQVLLLPADPAESITPGNPPADLDAYSATQAQLVTTPAVATTVAKQLGNVDPNTLAGQVTVSGSNILFITATDSTANRAKAIANGFAGAYLAYSRNAAVTALARTATVLKQQSEALLAQLDAPDVTSATANVINAQYQSVYSQYVTSEINQSLAQGNAKLLANASAAEANGGTSPVESLGFGALVGLLIGLAGAFLREQLNDRIRSRDEVEGASGGLPVLAEAPLARRAVRMIDEHGLDAAMMTELGECARALRTSIMFYTVQHEERRILVTSPDHGDGKTLVSTLLAAAYAQAGFRTVLVAADLRGSGPEQLVRSSERPGLTDALLFGPELEPGDEDRHAFNVLDFVASTDVANLSFLGRGSPAPNPGELLSSHRMDDLLDELARSYDILIIDSAPLLRFADTRPLVEKVDGVLLVATVGQNRRGITRAMDTLRPATVPWLGLLLNRAPGVDVNGPYRAQLAKV